MIFVVETEQFFKFPLYIKCTEINLLQLVRSLAIYKMHRNPSPFLEGMQGLSLINLIMPLERKDSQSPNWFTSCPFLTLAQRKATGTLFCRVGRNEVEWRSIPKHKYVLDIFFHERCCWGHGSYSNLCVVAVGVQWHFPYLQWQKEMTTFHFFSARYSVSQLQYWGS